MIIHVGQSLLVRVGLQHLVQLDHLRRGVHAAAPGEIVGGQYGADDRGDLVIPRQLGHRDDVAKDILERDHAVVVGDIIDAGQDDHRFRLQVDDVLAETDQHLGSGLATDATVQEIIVYKKCGVLRPPAIRDGIAHEDHLGGRRHPLVGVGVTAELRPITLLRLRGHACRHQQPAHRQAQTQNLSYSFHLSYVVFILLMYPKRNRP